MSDDEEQTTMTGDMEQERARAMVQRGHEALNRGDALEAFVWFERIMRDYNHLEQAEDAAAGLLHAERLALSARAEEPQHQRTMWTLAGFCVALTLVSCLLAWTAWSGSATLELTRAQLHTTYAESRALIASRDEAIIDVARSRAATERARSDLATHQLGPEYMYQRAILAEAPADGSLKKLDALDRADAEALRLFERLMSLHPDSPYTAHAQEQLDLLGLRRAARRDALKQAQRPLEAKLKQCRRLRDQLLDRNNLGVPVNPYTGDVLVGFLMDQERETGIFRERLKVSILEAKKMLNGLPDPGYLLQERLRTTCQLDRLGEVLVDL
jgi:hypothetical protein